MCCCHHRARPRLPHPQRPLIITAERILIASAHGPSTAEGQAPALLHRAPTPGPPGWAADLLCVGIGCRVLFSALVAVLVPQPPLMVAVQQAALMALHADSSGFCG